MFGIKITSIVLLETKNICKYNIKDKNKRVNIII